MLAHYGQCDAAGAWRHSPPPLTLHELPPQPLPPGQSAYLLESLWLVLVLSVLLLAARAAFVVPLCLVHNRLPHAGGLLARGGR